MADFTVKYKPEKTVYGFPLGILNRFAIIAQNYLNLPKVTKKY